MQAHNTPPTCKATTSRLYHADENTCLLNKDAAVLEVQVTQPQQDLDYHAPGIHDQHQAEDLRQRNRMQTFAFLCIFTATVFEAFSYVFVFYIWVADESAVLYVTSYRFLIAEGIYIVGLLLWGLIADGKLGRFKTIIGAALLNVGAVVLLAVHCFGNYVSKDIFPSKANTTIFYVAAMMVKFCFSGMKVNLNTFGADQIDVVGDRKGVEKFFLWIVWVTQIGTLLGMIASVTIQQNNFFFISYVIYACSMTVGVAVFALGRKYYVTIPLRDGYALDAFKIIWSAMISSICRKRAGAVQVESWLDRAKRSFGGYFCDIQVDDIKLLLKIFPIFLATVIYWAIYSQLLNIFSHQGTYMDLSSVKSNSILLGSFLAVENVTMIIIIPVIAKCVFPILAHYGVRLTPLKKMGAGMLFAAASAGVACLVEMERKKSKYGSFQQELFSSTVNASNMSVLYQSPQYILLGIADTLIFVTGCEFAYTESPRYIHSLIIAVSIAIIKVGPLLNIPIMYKLKQFQWQQIDLNQESLEYYLMVIVCLMLANFLVFAVVSSKYRYQFLPPPTERMRHFNLLDRRNT